MSEVLEVSTGYNAGEIGDDCRVAEEVCWARIRDVIMGVWRLIYRIYLITFRRSVNKSWIISNYYEIQVIYYGDSNVHSNIIFS